MYPENTLGFILHHRGECRKFAWCSFVIDLEDEVRLVSDSAQTIRLVMTTTATAEDAARLGRALVEERLAACATLVPAVQSIYRWEGKIESSNEALLLVKTSSGQLKALETRLYELHGYQTPEFLVLSVEACGKPYIEWLLSSLREA
jgi:periplasmic divalent cation tolerance protein